MDKKYDKSIILCVCIIMICGFVLKVMMGIVPEQKQIKEVKPSPVIVNTKQKIGLVHIMGVVDGEEQEISGYYGTIKYRTNKEGQYEVWVYTE